MKIFFYGPCRLPGGPCEVNRTYVKEFDKSISTKKHEDKILYSIFESVYKIIFSDCVVFSGLMFKSFELKIARLLKKKIIYLMHGSSLIETGVQNNLEKEILNSSDIIICVSELYMNLMIDLYPQHKDKFRTIYNGIDWEQLDIKKESIQVERDKNRIILFGGGRQTKRNLQICQAVDQINSEYHKNLHIDIYGYYRDNDDSAAISKIPCVTFHHVIPHDEINTELLKSQIYIQNSSFESFCLGVIDALALGCDILLSQNIGAKGIIHGLKESDIISDPFDIKEIKTKILNLLDHPNNARLMSSIDKDVTSAKAATQKLIDICNEK